MDTLMVFLNSNGLTTVTTLLVGLLAWIVYARQKKDTKRDIANSLLSEIQYIENSISRARDYIRDTDKADLNMQIVQVNSWPMHKHIFAADFDNDEWEAITTFYEKAHLLDETLRDSNRAFENNVEQIRVNLQRILADLTKETVEGIASSQESDAQDRIKSYNDKIEVFEQLYSEKRSGSIYTPAKYLNDAKVYLEDLSPLSTASIGTKLKQLSGQR